MKIARKVLTKIREKVSKFLELDKFSILVLGKSGVGKTILINAILNQEQNGATIGLPMTMENPQIKHTNRKLFPALDKVHPYYFLNEIFLISETWRFSLVLSFLYIHWIMRNASFFPFLTQQLLHPFAIF